MAEKVRPNKIGATPPKGGGFDFNGADGAGAGEGDGMATVSHGPYAEQLPVHGMSVEKIRRKFADRFDIDPKAEAIIDGNPVGDDTIVQQGQTLMFIRRAGEKGASESVVIEGNTVRATTPEGVVARVPLAQLLEQVSAVRMTTGDVVLPTGVRAVASRGPLTIWVHEKPPHIASFKWITNDSPSNYGSGTKYKIVKIALPYTIVFAVFTGNGQLGGNECFFRTEPLESLDDELCYPGLLNCSAFAEPGKEREGGSLSWICTQHLKYDGLPKDRNAQMQELLTRLLHCLHETGFNRSSESHEGASWYGHSAKRIKEISSVEKWEENTKKDPLFVLDLPWLKTGKTVRTMLDRLFKNSGAGGQTFNNASDIARTVFNIQGTAR
jgi:hypothetical protein